MQNLLLITHAFVSVLLVAAVLLQPGEAGMTGGNGFLSGGENFHTRRGFEKVLYYSTFVLMGIFVVLNILIVR